VRTSRSVLILGLGLQLVLGASIAQAKAKKAQQPQAAEQPAPAPTPMPVSTPAPAPTRAYEERGDYVVSPSAEKEVVARDSSAFNRIDKKYQATAILIGIGPSLSGTYGLQGSYFLTRNQLLMLEVTGGKLNYGTSISGSQSGSSGDLKTSSIGLHYKHFSGNSFYWRGGFDFRRATETYNYASDYYKFTGTSFAANFQIGNQWQWEYFTLGCDWIGVSVPLSHSFSDEQTSATAPSYYAGWLSDDEDLFVKRTNLTLLRFYLGASF